MPPTPEPVQPAPQPAQPVEPVQEIPVPKSPKRKFGKRTIWAAVGLVIVLIVVCLAVFVTLANSHAAEKKLGSDYIKAIQTGNYDKLGGLIYPPIKDVMERLGSSKQANISRDDGYKSILTKSGQVDMVGNNKPTKAKLVSVSTGGGAKHAILTYKVGDNFVSVIVVYDSSGKPHVLTMKEGDDKIDNESFKTEYEAINNDVKLTNTLLDQTNIPQGSSSAQVGPGAQQN